MDDLISRQAVLALPRNITRNMRGKVVEESIDVELLKALPTVQPEQEIIHCKDCKKFRKPSSIVNADWGWCSGWPTPLTTFVKVDGFCHRAEKRSEADG